MKRVAWKQMIALLMCALLLLTGCSFFRPKPAEENDDSEQILEQLEAMKEQLAAAKNEIESMKEAETAATPVPEPTAVPTPQIVVEKKTVEIPVESIIGVHCTVNGQESVRLDGATQVHAVADELDGYVFDHWEIDGVTASETGPEADFTLSEPSTICAVYHVRHVLTCINCYFQFLDAKGNAQGEKLTEFDFEEDYINPITKETCEGGVLNGYITSDLPSGQDVDYWLINGVKYNAPNTVHKFRVEELDEGTVYEVVLKKEQGSKKRYTVKTENCRFTGGGYSGADYGVVTEGTKITVTGYASKSYAAYGFFKGEPSGTGKGSSSNPLKYTGSDGSYYTFTYTVTIKHDTMITFVPVTGKG